MRLSWRGPRLLTALIVLAGSASASTTAARLSVSPAEKPSVLARTLQSKNATEAAASAYWLGLKGIGLALSRQIAEGHGGTLTLHNRSGGHGCEAHLRLPRSGGQ
jgi:signal transduction histidine kinase